MSEAPARYLARQLGDPSALDSQIMEAWVEAQLATLFEFGAERYSVEGSGIVVMNTKAGTAREIRPGDEFDMLYAPIAQVEAGVGVWSSPLGQVGLRAVQSYRPPAEAILVVLYQRELYGPYLVTRLFAPNLN